MIKKKLIFIVGISLVLTLFLGVNAFEYNEDNQGHAFYQADAEMKVPSINIKDLLILQPSSQPLNPELGMIYFDSDSKRLKLYDGSGWYSIVLEKVSSISKQQVKRTVEKEGEIKTCEFSITCDEWGDCINNYQSMTCVTTDENCDKSTDSETRDCVSESPFEKEIEQAREEPELESEPETIEDLEEESDVEEVEKEPEESEPEPEEETPVEEEIPEELFDITFDLEESVLGESDKLVVWITLQNFGRKYVPARLIYSVTDIESKEVYRRFEEIRVYTDESIIKQFDDLILEEGDYILTMSVEYAGIVEEFSDNFSVEKGIFSIIKRFFERLF